MARTRYRTVWISDTHLGSRGAQGETLATFLKKVDCETLYLVGDIIDFWRLQKRRAYWPDNHNDVLRRILKLIKRGTRVILIPGNHDEVLRQYAGMEIGGVHICLHALHECKNGQRLLVTHGDQYDLVVTKQKLLSFLGATAYEHLLTINRWYNRYRRWRGLPYWSLSQYLKLKVKSACTYVSRFQDTLLKEATAFDADGVICGHIHKPEIKVNDDSMDYYNCGDWIENCTAIVEHLEGRIELINAHDVLADDHQHEEDDVADVELNLDPTQWLAPVRVGQWRPIAEERVDESEAETVLPARR